jgi:hypothetical protein
MKRVSVLYKRYAQAVLIAIGVGICLFFNADALRIVNDLWIDPTVRGALVAAAQNVNSAGFVQPTPAPNATSAPTSSNPTPTPATFAQQFGSTQTNITTLVGQLNGVPLGWDCQEYNKIFRSGAVTPTPTAPPAAGAPAAPAPTATPAPGFIAELTSACTQENGQQLMGGRVSGPVLLQKLVGILLMSAGVGFGAPFWFDLLGKLISLRPDKPS